MMTRTFLLVGLAVLSGCKNMGYVDESLPTEFTYDMPAAGHSKAENWKTARDYFASSYGDSRAVFSVQDPDDGTMIGKGVAPWHLRMTTLTCDAQYEIQFAAKDDKARLRFRMIYGQMLGPQNCTMWPRPTPDGYASIRSSFEAMAAGLKDALSGGKASTLKDF